MTTITDDDLFKYADRAKGKVVVLTGGASGIGKESAFLFAKHGAKVVIGDLDAKGADAVVSEINSAGGDAAFLECNVLKWDALVDLFELAISRYGAVDIVIPNAGVTESERICTGEVTIRDGRPVPPKLLTMQINLTAVLHTVHLGLHYMKRNRAEGDWKAVILIGSMASWQAIPLGPQYSATKHAVLGLMRSLHTVHAPGVRFASIHPWFADTKILPLVVKLALAGIPLTPVARIAGAIFHSATDPDSETNGLPWLLPDDGYVLRLDREELHEGVYGLIDRRVRRISSIAASIRLTVGVFRDLVRLLLGRGVFLVPAFGLVYAVWSGLVTLPF